MQQTRRIAAIMFTDIVGYTAMMGKDEQKALELISLNRQIQKPIIEKFNGRWIKELGDGVMASFDTASDAVQAAIEIQKACRAAKQFQLKIGIHMGEVIVENNDLFGDSVNIASRIETLAIENSILFSKSVYDQVKNHPLYTAVSLGKFSFKNVSEPLEIFALSTLGLAIPKRKEMKGKLESKKGVGNFAKILIPVLLVIVIAGILFNKERASITTTDKMFSLAILPFENPEKDSTLTYLSAGIPENLINRLTDYSGVKVFARTATFGLPDTIRNIAGIKNLLKADVILLGRLGHENGRYALNCELVDVATQNQIWGNKYYLTSLDVSRIEDSIVMAMMEPLQLSEQSNPNFTENNRKVNPAAYAEYLKGRFLSYGSTYEESEKALEHFRNAIQLDPKYAAAYAAIGNEKIVQALFSNASSKEIINEARTAIEAAKAMDPNLPEIYTSEGALKFYFDWDWKGAVESYKKALQLDPNNATIYIRYSTTLADISKHKEALPLAKKAVELDPISISSLHNLGWVYQLAGNYKESAETFQKAIDLHPDWIWGYIKQGYDYIFLKEYDKAIANAQKAESLLNNRWGSELLQSALAFIYTYGQDEERANAVISRFMDYASKNKIEDPINMSLIHVLKNEYEEAIEWEKKAIDTRSPGAYLMNIEIFYPEEYFNSVAHRQNMKTMGIVN